MSRRKVNANKKSTEAPVLAAVEALPDDIDQQVETLQNAIVQGSARLQEAQTIRDGMVRRCEMLSSQLAEAKMTLKMLERAKAKQ